MALDLQSIAAMTTVTLTAGIMIFNVLRPRGGCSSCRGCAKILPQKDMNRTMVGHGKLFF